ncbi:hypothetical protein Tco_0313292 [Tanacetum coccineum]
MISTSGEVRARTLFVLSSSNRGRLLGFIDLMRQKNKIMKQAGLIKHYGILQKMEDSTRYDKEGNKINIEDLLKKIKTKLMLIEDKVMDPNSSLGKVCLGEDAVIDTKEISDRFVAPCFVNGLKAYDGEINLGVEENMISNEYAVKLCLEHEVKKGNKVVKSFLRMTKAITDFGARTVTIYPDVDPFLEETEEEGKSNDD